MSNSPQFTRRRFLKRALAMSAACGLTGRGAATERQSQSATATVDEIIDTYVYLGRWPHQRLAADEPGELMAMLRRNHISCAWVGSFDGLFHKDVAGVNERLAKMCTVLQVVGLPTDSHARRSKSGDSSAAPPKRDPFTPRLIPLGSVNPTLPDWEEDVRRCHESFKMPGIRLHPNYHGYTLDDPRFGRLLEIASDRGLVVQLVARMDETRHRFLNPQSERVDLKPLAALIGKFPRLRLVVSNGHSSSDDAGTNALLEMEQLYFDFGRASTVTEIRQLMEKASPNRVVFGSCAPLHSFEPMLIRMRDLISDIDALRAVAYANASRLLPLPEKLPQ